MSPAPFAKVTLLDLGQNLPPYEESDSIELNPYQFYDKIAENLTYRSVEV